ncbi:TPR end-of-group domain-containing protein [Methylomonas sp. BW4-1]|uniref:Tetratricopeptide repeat protein n=1 Tax=Methylomonas defluvii TaxID=3045149 RepID=A0ABU4ULA3_9GAMM|nr:MULTISPECIES: hypothetical protein [unclassified Methylomonas]MDX8130200.1 hypothetical protein [Methylomonas sp. OY6]QSB00275.1 hypothetical protein JWZ98_16515 [Methylomonas sp. EFPC1]
MSLLSSFKKRSTLDAAIKQVAQARKSEGSKAEQLYKGAYQGFANVIADHLIVSEALYHWGFGLLHEARTQEPKAAIEIYEDAISKFSFCLLISPNYLGAAIDGGVAFMELARISAEAAKPDLYDLAEDFFEKACAIQKGSAAYNLACVYALRGDNDACLAALQTAREFGSLPDEQNILQDDDMAGVINAPWFKAFMEEVRATPAPEKTKLKDIEINVEPGFKIEKKEDFDYYS